MTTLMAHGLRVAARGLRTRMPGLSWRARNAFEHLRWSGARVLGRPNCAYDDRFWDLHHAGDWTGFAALVVRFFEPRTIADVGCGDGKLLTALREVAPAVGLAGYDGSPVAVARAGARGIAVVKVDLAFAGRSSYRGLADRVAGTDVAICLESAEHLPWWSATGLVHVLTRARIVVFSAAQPNQGGTDHLHERPLAYWRGRFEAAGFERHPLGDAFARDVARLDLPWWYGANVQVFRTRG